MMVLIYYSASIILGFILGIYYKNRQISTEERKFTQQVEDIFSNVLSNVRKGRLKFSKRFNKYVHFKCGKYFVVYTIDNCQLSIFQGEICIALSNQIDPKITNEISDFIEHEFSKEINDVVEVDGNLISKNCFPNINNSQKWEDSFLNKIEDENNKKENKLNLDHILDKISDTGYETLTEIEKEFLKNFSK